MNNNQILQEPPELTRVSSKGQVVIPSSIRTTMHIKEGDILATVTSGQDMIILKRIHNPILADDLQTLKEVKEAWNEIEQGKSRTMNKEEFLKDLKTWQQSQLRKRSKKK